MADEHDDAAELTRTPAANEGRLVASVILVVGVPAAGTSSLVRVLADLLPDGTDLAVILALQHRKTFDEDGFRRALGAWASALVPAADGAPVEVGRVYLPDPGAVVTMHDGRLRVQLTGPEADGRGAIDNLFVSVAANLDGHTVGLVLAGTGEDGTLGLAAVKQAGGLTLAEAMSGADPETMAASTGPAALADLVLPLAEIAPRITSHAHHLARLHRAATPAAGTAGPLDQIAAVLHERTGHDFHGYKRPTFLRRVQRRMEVVSADTFAAYLGVLHSKPSEVQDLFGDLLIGVTRFFRDPREFDFLEREVVPKLFEGKGRGDRVRVWVPGCSSGEEAYSVAMLLREFAAKFDVPPSIQIFATDLDRRALALARAGRYRRDIETDVGPARLARWFVDEGDTYVVSRELRDACVFTQHSLIKDIPFSHLDLIACRNLLIYFGSELQDRVISLFHYALEPSGYLFLGTAESVTRHARLFATVDGGFRTFRKLETARLVLPDFPLPAVVRVPSGGPAQSRREPVGQRLVRRAERVAERFAPAYIVVDDRFNTLHLSAHAGRFIRPDAGAFSPNLLDLVHADLRPDLRGALTKVAREGQPVRVSGARVDLDGQDTAVDLLVEPVPDGPEDATAASRGFVVLFTGGLASPEVDDTGSPSSQPQDQQVRRLTAELGSARERLRAMTEVQTATTEELKASNEEYQSLNEELQSSNEELATSKEELQSLNEELTTVNGELAHRVDELGHVNSDLKNLQQATQIASVFLDHELRVTSFTSAADEVFHLVEADLGRPIAHIKARVAYDDLEDDARRVLRTLAPAEREVEDPATRARYIARVLPYRSTSNVIAGTVVTFTDVTALSRVQERLRESEARFRALATAGAYMVYRMSPDWRQMYQLNGQQILADTAEPVENWADNYLLPEDRPTVFAAIEAAIRSRSLFELEHRVRRADGSVGWVLSRAVPTLGPKGEITEWFGAGSDVSERHDAVERLREREATYRADLERQVEERTAELKRSRDLLQATMDSSMDMIQVFEAVRDESGEIVDFRWVLNNHASEQRYGDVVGRSLLQNNPGVVEVGIFDTFKQVVETGQPDQSERHYVHEQFNGWFFQSAVKLGDGVATTTSDITERKKAEQEVLRLRDDAARTKLHESEERLRTLMHGIPQLVWRSDDQGAWTWSSPQWQTFTGQTSGESLGRGWLDAVHPDDRAAAAQAWQEARADGFLDVEFRLRRASDGSYLWHHTRSAPVRDRSGRITEWLGTSTDMQRLKELQEGQAVMVAELQHRTRNLIAVVRSIAMQTMASTGPAKAFEAEFFDRLSALARAQGLLSRAEQEPITIDALLRMELDALSVNAAPLRERVHLQGPEGVRLRNSIVQTLALALHELATNARKYGALAAGDGRLAVTWQVCDVGGAGRRLVLEWIEQGIDRAREEQSSTTRSGGYGRELIERALPYALGARTECLFVGVRRCIPRQRGA